MTVERVKCVECDHMILPQTAAANGGLCTPCAKTPEWLRGARMEYESKLSSGELFTPSQEQRGTAKRPTEFADPAASWSPEPEFYKDREARSPQEVIDLAATQPQGHAFLERTSFFRSGRLSCVAPTVFPCCQGWHYGGDLHRSEAPHLRGPAGR